ncbi:MAG: aldehyde dehydrogenase family protein [Bacteroidales bacterium]|nr:aldehyde dehydrogenase family protein [Bacteroidales bacterium]
MEKFKIFCGGEFLDTKTSLSILNPETGKPVGMTSLASVEIVEKAIVAALQVKIYLKNMSSFKRYEILTFIRNGMLRERDSFAELICLESGKPIRFAFAEVDRSIQSFAVAAEESRRLPRESMSLDWTLPGSHKEGLLKYFPIGVVAGISPFNFPLNLAVHKIAPAIAAGCPIILKPSSSTPLSTLKLSQIISESGLPHGAVSVLPMDRKTGNLLVTDHRISLLSFTGSPSVGWEMKKQAGKKKVLLELGGNAGVIISKGTRMEEAIPKCINGAFSYSGQVCIHAQRIYVLKELFKEFVDGFIEGTRRLKKGTSQDPETDISVMIDEANAKRVESWILEAVSEGATILLGGHREGSYLEPTILTGTQMSMKVCCEEAFGPVVVVEPVTSFSQAVDLINAGCFGLQAGVFTDSIEEMNRAFNDLEVGGVIINDVPTFRVDHMPYGGVKESGSGREGIRFAMLEMMEPRLLVKNT